MKQEGGLLPQRLDVYWDSDSTSNCPLTALSSVPNLSVVLEAFDIRKQPPPNPWGGGGRSRPPIGRIGDWSPLNLSGNPTKSIEVPQYRQGYKQKAFQIGYLEGSAVPMTGNKAFQLVDYLDSTAAATPAGFSRLVLERDIVMILLLWESYLRGNDSGKVCLTDFFHPHGQPVSYPLPSTVPAGFTLLLAPYGTLVAKVMTQLPRLIDCSQQSPKEVDSK